MPHPSFLIPHPSCCASRNRRGSALLIVLGMVAFLVISAVAFSAYMRYSRLPSSYLRRTSSSRLLAKAALAEAIDQIDIAIGNDPFPFSMKNDADAPGEFMAGGDYSGDGYDSPRTTTESLRAVRRRRNYWRSHCFIGTNRLVEADETVSTLTLEGLAYLPPALINEARFYSRHSDGARWRNFSFDSGRYAFFAIDVSDHLDINRVFADRARTSADDGKITLAHVFENTAHTGVGSPTPTAWDEFLAEFNPAVDTLPGEPKPSASSSKLPLISLADWNVALYEKQRGWGAMMSPFCRYVMEGGKFVTDTGTDGARLSTMAFLTDSYLPNTNTAATAMYDLCSAQPFSQVKSGTGASSQKTVTDIIGSPTALATSMLDWGLSGIDLVSLYDYLDENDVPASLALPTTERVPMICALQPVVQMQIEPLAAEESPTRQERDALASAGTAAAPPAPTVTVTRKYKLKVSNMNALIGALTAYPFCREKETEGIDYTLDYAIRIGFTTDDGPGLRAPFDEQNLLDSTKSSAFIVADDDDFNNTRVENGVIKIHQQASGKPKSSGVTDQESAFTKLDTSCSCSLVEQFFNDFVAFEVTYTHHLKTLTDASGAVIGYTYDDSSQPPTIDTSVQPKVSSQFHPLDADGRGDGGFTPASLLAPPPTPVKVTPYVTVTARIKSGESKRTVDLVPASVYDDNHLNGIFNDSLMAIGSEMRPLLTLVGDNPIEFSEAGFNGTPVMVTAKPKAGGSFVDSLICPDPRWNFMPENFYGIAESVSAGDWFLQKCGIDEKGRDCDIFMAHSGQGYMQSLGELAMLPRTAEVFNSGDPIFGDCAYHIVPNTKKMMFEPYPTSGAMDPFTALPHGKLMWRMYRLFDHEGLDPDPIYDMGITSGGTGFRINPFTSSKSVMMAALANTPYSWWAAGTNYTARGKSGQRDMGAMDFNEKYAFSQMNGDAKFAWKDLELIAEKMMKEMRRQDGKWEIGYDGLDWDGETDGTDICGATFEGDTDELYDVDRKFLYAYWRDCFAAKQQLFLVFVRAEPTLMGGGAVGATPPALGVRAVALVWRDPTPTPTTNGSSQPIPHRTRVLFYRQFD